MSKSESPYRRDPYWLDKRRDGNSPDIWQIATASTCKGGTRSILYRSTGCKRLEEAIAELDAYADEKKSEKLQASDDAGVAPLLMVYWKERGRSTINCDQSGRSIYTFFAFLEQDEVGVKAVVTDLTPATFERFRKWRMGPHAFTMQWGERFVHYNSVGVSGATVQRNINDIRAGIQNAKDNLRITAFPKIHDVERKHLSPPRDRVLSLNELARIVWYAYHEPAFFRFVVLQMVTSVRPMAANKFDPRKQFLEARGMIDLQPDATPQTKKRNAIIPAIRPIRPVLKAWKQDVPALVVSRKTRWRIMRRVLGLSDDVFPKTIRHTIATWLYEMDWVPERQISEVLGHTSETGLRATSRVYAKYRPEKMGKLVKALNIIWMKVSREARAYGADHLLTTTGKGGKLMVTPRSPKL